MMTITAPPLVIEAAELAKREQRCVVEPFSQSRAKNVPLQPAQTRSGRGSLARD
jgi:hypothetical protein